MSIPRSLRKAAMASPLARLEINPGTADLYSQFFAYLCYAHFHGSALDQQDAPVGLAIP